MKIMTFTTKEESLVKNKFIKSHEIKVFGTLIMICATFFHDSYLKRVLRITHLNTGLSNKRPRHLFLSYIKCPGVNSSLASNHTPATNRANRAYRQNLQTSETYVSRTFDLNDIKFGRMVKKAIFFNISQVWTCSS